MPDDPTPQVRPGHAPEPQTSSKAPAHAPDAAPDKPPTREHHDAQGHGLKETLTSITIAFVLAFVFRGFVVEAFQIPTGSMAPTLLGAHMRFDGKDTGYEWTVGPWYYGANQVPSPIQAPASVLNSGDEYFDANGLQVTPIVVSDPMSGMPVGGISEQNGFPIGVTDVPIDAGDRIFVLKHLYRLLPTGLGGPARWDCIVFRDPVDPSTNFIKRLIGLPGEQIALVDGDVFVRDAEDGKPAPWSDASWRVARKPERVQRAVWQPVYSSAYHATPIPDFDSPWEGLDEKNKDLDFGGWDTSGRVYSFDGSRDRTTLDWQQERKPIDDLYPYNQTPGSTQNPRRPTPAVFPVPDVALSMGYEPEKDLTGNIVAYLRVTGRDLRVTITPREVQVDERPLRDVNNPNPAWRRRDAAPHHEKFPAHKITNVEIWHADQAVWVFVNGKRIYHWTYEMNPVARIEQSMRRTWDSLLAAEAATTDPTFFDNPGLYAKTDVAWIFENTGAFKIHDVALSRDIYYQPGAYGSPYAPTSHSRDQQPFAATHPLRNPVVLNGDQFFGLGDNSPASSDGRAWDKPDPWVRETVDPTIGVINRDLLIGKAFFVYFPAPHRVAGRAIIPDFGHLRWVW